MPRKKTFFSSEQQCLIQKQLEHHWQFSLVFMYLCTYTCTLIWDISNYLYLLFSVEDVKYYVHIFFNIQFLMFGITKNFILVFWLKILALKSSSSSRRTNQFPLLSAPKGNEPAAITELPSTSIIIAVLSICQSFLNEWNKTFLGQTILQKNENSKKTRQGKRYKCLNLNLGEKFTLGKLWCKISDRNILVGNFQWTIFGRNILVGNIAYIGS